MAGPETPTVLVTGGARGIGRATVEWFVAHGHRVIATSWQSPVPEELRTVATWLRADLNNAASVDDLVAQATVEVGAIDVFVGNAGRLADGLAMRMSDHDFVEVLQVNLFANERLARAVLPIMRARAWGRIVFVSSVGGLLGAAGQSNYAASKAALTGLAGAIAVEAAADGVTCNVVAPGPVDTELLRSLGPERLDAFETMVPSGRLGTPAEVAAVIGFLCSSEASFVNGVVLPVDGGLMRAESWGRSVKEAVGRRRAATDPTPTSSTIRTARPSS